MTIVQIGLIGAVFGLGVFSGCVTSAYRPCTEGGETARDYKGKLFRGTRQCHQEKDKFGRWSNHGVYREWYESGQLAVQGEYRQGKKVGRWIEYDEQGKKTSDRILEEPKEEKLR